MIQRLQTVYLLLAFVAFLVCALCERSLPLLCGGAAVMALLSLADVFLYKQRPRQALLCLGVMALAVAYYVAQAVYNHAMGGALELTWPMALPAVGVVLLFMARKGIIKDERLVRSLDRIR